MRYLVKTCLAESVGLKDLARRLEARGVESRGGADWSNVSVRGILTNQLITGTVTYGRRTMKLNRQTGRRVPRRNDDSMHLSYQDDGLRLVSDEDFEHVQEKVAARGGHRRNIGRSVRPFTGLLRCAKCGSVFYGRKSRNARGNITTTTAGIASGTGRSLAATRRHCARTGLSIW